MTPSCGRCGGCIIDEPSHDYYRTRRWRCVNCGWYREDVAVRPGRAVILSTWGNYERRG